MRNFASSLTSPHKPFAILRDLTARLGESAPTTTASKILKSSSSSSVAGLDAADLYLRRSCVWLYLGFFKRALADLESSLAIRRTDGKCQPIRLFQSEIFSRRNTLTIQRLHPILRGPRSLQSRRFRRRFESFWKTCRPKRTKRGLGSDWISMFKKMF